MASLNRQDLLTMYYDLRLIYSVLAKSRGRDALIAKRKAKEAAARVESCIGQVDTMPVSAWE